MKVDQILLSESYWCSAAPLCVAAVTSTLVIISVGLSRPLSKNLHQANLHITNFIFKVIVIFNIFLCMVVGQDTLIVVTDL